MPDLGLHYIASIAWAFKHLNSVLRCYKSGVQDAVWPDWAKFCHFGQSFRVYPESSKILNLLWQTFLWYWANIYCCWPKICSSGHTGGMAIVIENVNFLNINYELSEHRRQMCQLGTATTSVLNTTTATHLSNLTHVFQPTAMWPDCKTKK